ncbi:hypothetical protein O6H91_09G042200 [Diphasiastrum complanatum]|uniref:Uncharacterized protein n=1 Tax=Diphasiastrum complanatum TaxID=34168 RepID=A0ACC2CNF1_DIPCM|nr:hypothetical protein O6H91_09G042200 [Diphasiastrum complanatum]
MEAPRFTRVCFLLVHVLIATIPAYARSGEFDVLGYDTAVITPRNVIETGSAYWFDNYTSTSCYGNDTSKFGAGPDIVKLAPHLYSNSTCGLCLNVTCLHGLSGTASCTKYRSASAVVKVVGECTDTNCFDLTLSIPVFDALATDRSAIRLAYTNVTCPF